MFSVEVKVGRLLESRLAAPVKMSDIEGFQEQLIQIFRKHRVKLVAATDVSRASVFPPEVANRLLEVLKADSSRIERSGILVGQSAIFSLQIERLITEAGNPLRRSFREPFDLKLYLGNLLNPEESARLAQFLTGTP